MSILGNNTSIRCLQSIRLLINKTRSMLFKVTPPPEVNLKRYWHLFILTDKKIVLILSEKAGFTFALKWFFEQSGILDDALNHHPWIHNYRKEVYQKSEEYRLSLINFLNYPDEFLVIKITRHPLKRAVSSYIHACRYNIANDEISNLLGREISKQNKYSFREFVSFLESLDIQKCDPHFQLQTKDFEVDGTINVDRIIDLEKAVDELLKLETEFGLRQTNIFQYIKSFHNNPKIKNFSFYGDTIVRFEGKNIIAPDAKYFYDDDLLQRIGKIYAEDFKRYGYKCSISEI